MTIPAKDLVEGALSVCGSQAEIARRLRVDISRVNKWIAWADGKSWGHGPSARYRKLLVDMLNRARKVPRGHRYVKKSEKENDGEKLPGNQ